MGPAANAEAIAGESQSLLHETDAEGIAALLPTRAEVRPQRKVRPGACCAALVLSAATAGVSAIQYKGRPAQDGEDVGMLAVDADATISGVAALDNDDPNWGCGLVGHLPGINQSGVASYETQRLIDGIKGSSTFNMATYWNWNLAPQTEDGSPQVLTKDFIFMPEQWGAGVVENQYLRQAGVANYLDSNGKVSQSTMATILLGSNEPDIYGSCMGNMFGECKKPCSTASVQAHDCPACNMKAKRKAHANKKGECNCWQYSHATGVGFWPFDGCSGEQPLPGMWSDPACVDKVMDSWRKTAAVAVGKGYKFLSTPLVATNMDYVKRFIEKACETCQDASCGCPQYIGFHFYAYDCQPVAMDGYKTFQKRLDAARAIMEEHPFVKGAIINEVGMLNCAGEADNPICVPDSGRYPAKDDPEHGCPKTEELPEGLASFIKELFRMVAAAKTSDGRAVVKGFSWFSENMAGGTYNLQLFDRHHKLNAMGEAYIEGCSKWAEAQKAR